MSTHNNHHRGLHHIIVSRVSFRIPGTCSSPSPSKYFQPCNNGKDLSCDTLFTKNFEPVHGQISWVIDSQSGTRSHGPSAIGARAPRHCPAEVNQLTASNSAG